MAYADYDFYLSTYGGTLSECDYCRHADTATARIDFLTRGKAASAPEEMREQLSFCCCEMVDYMASSEQARAESLGGAVTSVSNAGYSVSFAAESPFVVQGRAAVEICRRWLTQPQNLMNRWC